jgi:hypothetical protein
MNSRSQIMMILAGLSLLATATTFANDFAVDWYTIGGGGRSEGDGFVLTGTIGQDDSGEMAGGDFELTGGFGAGGGEFCFGDLDGDGQVGLGDLAQLLAHYAMTSGMSYEDGDLDGDGDVDLADLAALLAVYGTICE